MVSGGGPIWQIQKSFIVPIFQPFIRLKFVGQSFSISLSAIINRANWQRPHVGNDPN